MKRNDIPHKSTTHAERFYHITEGPARGTVFMREEPAGIWTASAAVLSETDTFNRRKGRTVARRRFFNEGGYACSPNYESAQNVLRAFAKRYGKLD